MSDKTLRHGVRGLVVAAMACAIFLTWSIRVVMSPSSGGFYGLIIYLPIVAAPGWIVWAQPLRARWLAVWGVVGWVSTIIYQIVGEPYQYEEYIANWAYIETPLLILMPLVLFGVPIAGFMVAAHNRRAIEGTANDSPLARGLQRVAHLAVVLGIVAVTCGSLTGNLIGVLVVLVYVSVLVLPAAFVARDPRRKRAWLWTAWTVPLAAFGLLATYEDYSIMPLPWQLVCGSIGTMFVLLLIVMPIVALVARDDDKLPAARVR